MLAGLAEGTSELRQFSAAIDCHSTLKCMSALGADVKSRKRCGEGDRARHARIEKQLASSGRGQLRYDDAIAGRDFGGQAFNTKLTGDDSLQKRPMKRIVGPLREMGADIRARDDNFAPLEIHGAKLKAIDYQMPMASAQVKSAVLLAGLFAEGVTTVIEPARTRDHTELALEEFGATIEKHGKTTRVHALAQRLERRRKVDREIVGCPRGFIQRGIFYRRGIAVSGIQPADS